MAVPPEAAARRLRFDELKNHLDGHGITKAKWGLFMGQEQHGMFLVEGFLQASNGEEQGRWLLKYRGEIAYISPNLFALMEDCVYDVKTGQTLSDGSVMSVSRAVDLTFKKEEGEIVPAPVKKVATKKRLGEDQSSLREAKRRRLTSGSKKAAAYDRKADIAAKATMSKVFESKVVSKVKTALPNTKKEPPKKYAPPSSRVNTVITDAQRDKREADFMQTEKDFLNVDVQFTK